MKKDVLSMGVIFIFLGLLLYVTESDRGFHIPKATGALIVVLGLFSVLYSGWQYFKNKNPKKTKTNEKQLP